MKKAIALILAIIMLLAIIPLSVMSARAAPSYVDSFLSIVGPMCTADMRDNHILASFSLSQAIWESGWGRSTLATQANALFGIRAYSGWKGKIFDRNECIKYENWDALRAAKGEDYVKENTLSFWRAYDSWQESVTDHSALFNGMSIYANLRGNYDYKSCAQLVVEDGYCGDPGYTEALITVIEQYNLESYNYNFEAGGTPEPELPSEPAQPEVPTPTIKISPSVLLMDVNTAYSLTVNIQPANAEYAINSDNAVITVEGNTLNANAHGSATVTVSSGDINVKCHVIVQEGYGGIIADGVYVKCTSSGRVTIPSEAKSIAAGAFDGVNVESVVIGNNVVSIQDGAFPLNTGLTLCSYESSVVREFASTNSIQYVNLSTKWQFDNSALIVMNVPTFTTATVLYTYYDVSGGQITLTQKDNTPLDKHSIVGTGCKLTVDGKTYTVMVKGDVNGDGKNSTADMIVLKKYLMGNDSALPDRAYRRAADFNGDNRITTADYLQIFQVS